MRMKFLYPSVSSVLLLLCKRGQAFELAHQPKELTSIDGVLEVTLNVSLLESLEGIPWSNTNTRIGAAYNGFPVGPTLRLKPGDLLRVHLNNHLEPVSTYDAELYEYIRDPTNDDANVTIISNRLGQFGGGGEPVFGYWGFRYANIHFHGMSFPPRLEDIRTYVGGGEGKTYELQVAPDKESSLNWYHSHVQSTTASAYLASLFGFVVVEGTTSDLLAAPGISDAVEVFMAFSEATVNADGTIPPRFPRFGHFNWTVVVNGHLPEETVYSFVQGDVALFRVVNANVEAPLLLSLNSHSAVVVARDGLPLPKPFETDVVKVESGSRAEFLVRFDTPGDFTMTRLRWPGNQPEDCARFNFFPCVSYDVDRVAATVNVVALPSFECPEEDLIETIELPGDSDRLVRLASLPSVGEKTITMENDRSRPLFQVPGPEGRSFAFGMNKRMHNPTYSHGTVMAGTCETWLVENDPPFSDHPIHTHGANFRVMEIDGVAVKEPFWRDTLEIGANATIHVCFDQLTAGDSFLVHCHMPAHLDSGMAMQYSVIAREDLSKCIRRRKT